MRVCHFAARLPGHTGTHIYTCTQTHLHAIAAPAAVLLHVNTTTHVGCCHHCGELLWREAGDRTQPNTPDHTPGAREPPGSCVSLIDGDVFGLGCCNWWLVVK